MLKLSVSTLSTIALVWGASTSFVSAQSNDLSSCLKGLEAQATKVGIAKQTYRDLTDGLQSDPTVLQKLDYQPEFRSAIWDYLASLVDDERVFDGKQMLQDHHDLLKRVERSYGVDPATVVAVWGVESNFGKNMGKYSLLTSLATLSCEGRRQDYFRKEFFATLRIIQSGDIEAERMIGSWAGAFGHTQFMPSTFERIAVDFDGDGHRDLMDNTPDSLASTANYLKRNGWQSGQPWGFEVSLPAGFNTTDQGRRKKSSVGTWTTRGFTLVNGNPLSSVVDEKQMAGLITPAGSNGPAFLVFKNFDVIYSYNAAESYALAIAHLADKLRGGSDFVTPWPTDDAGLSRAQRKQLQEILATKGYDIGTIDGIIGSKTRDAIKAEQTRLGFPVNGNAGQKILKALQP